MGTTYFAWQRWWAVGGLGAATMLTWVALALFDWMGWAPAANAATLVPPTGAAQAPTALPVRVHARKALPFSGSV